MANSPSFARSILVVLLLLTAVFSLKDGWYALIASHVVAGMATFFFFVWTAPTQKEMRRNPMRRWTMMHTWKLILFACTGFAALCIFCTMPELEPEPVVSKK